MTRRIDKLTADHVNKVLTEYGFPPEQKTVNEHERRQRSHHGSAVLLAMEATKLETLTEEQLLDVESWSRHFADRALALRRKLQTKQQ